MLQLKKNAVMAAAHEGEGGVGQSCPTATFGGYDWENSTKWMKRKERKRKWRECSRMGRNVYPKLPRRSLMLRGHCCLLNQYDDTLVSLM
ncbi:uncharacterized protein G2W53_004196 [Senna tora]|uniref:Uncharacterized protein n=1 Tax=Senna tora TaxID=362788 RepID=A0A834XA65_9FABA|nr:uncharacterized protein G2W53_004196 [Senna tora]